MAVKVLRKRSGNRYDLTGLSTDVKPTTISGETIGYGSTFYVEDTTTPYLLGGSGWVVDKRRGSTVSGSDVASVIHAATSKTTPVDADEWGIWDSITGALKKLSWANSKATLAAVFAPIPVTTSIASSATPTPAVGTSGAPILYVITALAEAAEFGAPTGTPTNGQQLLIRIKDDGTARDLTYNAIYDEGDDLALPTTTVINKTMYLSLIYDSTAVKWQYIGGIGGF